MRRHTLEGRGMQENLVVEVIVVFIYSVARFFCLDEKCKNKFQHLAFPHQLISR